MPSRQQRSKMAARPLTNRAALIAAGIAAVAALAAAIIHWSGAAPPPAPIARVPAEATIGKVMGVAAAPVTVEVFSDFLCTHCADFVTQVEPGLITEFVKPGIARIVYRHFPIVAPLSETAALASECAADQQRFWAYHDALFARLARGALRGRGDLEAASRETGLDQATFTQCLRSGAGRARVDADRADGERRGVRGTPTSFVNGQMIVGAQPIEVFRGAIDTARKP